MTDDAMTADTVAMIGLGAMGLSMAARLAEAGPVVGFDPDPARAEPAGEARVRVAASPAEAAGDASVVLLAVRDEAQLRAALLGGDGVLAGIAQGAAVVVTSTVGRGAVRAVEPEVAARGVRLVDAPVSGGPARGRAGALLIVVGGSEADVAAVRPVLDRLASRLEVVGDAVGDGQVLKTINQLLAGVHIAAAAEAVALAGALGLDPAATVDLLGAGAAQSFMLGDRGPRMVQEGAEVRSRLDIFVKDLGLVAALARDAHVPVPVASAAQQLFQIAERAGLGARDDSSVVRVLAPPD